MLEKPKLRVRQVLEQLLEGPVVGKVKDIARIEARECLLVYQFANAQKRQMGLEVDSKQAFWLATE